MAKKKRKKSKRARTPRLSSAQLVRPGQAEAGMEAREKEAASMVKPVKPRTTGKELPDLREEYQYVAADLKRIAIIAMGMLVIMIVLAVWLI